MTIQHLDRRIEEHSISERAYKKLMQIPWNVPIDFQGMTFDPITSECIRGYRILDAR